VILRTFPDLTWLKQEAEKNFISRKAWNGDPLQQAGWPTVVLNTMCKQTYRDNILGPLSLFCNVSGQSMVHVDGYQTTIKEGLYFITNAGQRYTLEIDEPHPTETLNIHFGEAFAEHVITSLVTKPEKQLDGIVNSHTIIFKNRLIHKSKQVEDVIRSIHQNHTMEPLELDEKLAFLITLLLLEEQHLKASSMALPALKKSTREEILNRLLRATDYIYSHYDQPIDLETLASASCLSRFHFLRLFKAAFQFTPYQFLTKVRIQKAKTLLADKTLSVVAISKKVGIAETSSFSRLFYTNTGLYPTQFRNAVKN
jgi:AraC family transcriptional regulator